MRKVLLSIACLLFGTSHAFAADLAVPGTYATIQAAINAAASGDRVMIAPGVYNECVTLPNKGTLASRITIRSSTADGNLPAAGVRLANPDGAPPTNYNAVLATIHAPNNGCAAIDAAVGARDYNIGPGLKITGPTAGYRAGVELGLNTSSFQFEADQPTNITLQRVWVTAADPWVGLKTGVEMHGRNLQVIDSYINDIKGIGQDTKAIGCINGTGPLVIRNNFLNAAGYHFLCGGDRPNMMTYADINAGATTTTATLSSFKSGHTIATLKVGQHVSILSNGGTMRYHPKIVSCGTSTPGATCSSNTITYEAIPVAPDTGTASDIQWGAIPTDITIRRNYFWKDPAWLNNILNTVVVSSATPSTSAGSLAAGTYYYRVQAGYSGYQGSRVSSTASTEVSATLSATGQVTLNWGAVTGPAYMTYRVFRSTTTGTYAGYIDVGNVTSYVDTGAALTGTSGPSGGSNWVMKNVFEVKFGINIQVDSNIFENSPVGSEAGYAMWLKSNEYNGANYMHTRNLIIEKNVMDGMDGCFSVLGRIDTTGANFTRPLENFVLRNNICFDSGAQWMMGKSGVFMTKIQSPVNGMTIENNTLIHQQSSAFYFVHTGPDGGGSDKVDRFALRNNIMLKGAYGVFGEGCAAHAATECFTEFVTGVSPFLGNVFGGTSMGLPAGNTLISVADFEGPNHFVNYQKTGGVVGDFALKPTSSLKGTADGGGDPGANIAALEAATSGVKLGTAEGTSAPDITTAPALGSVPEDSAISPITLAVTGGTAPYTWAIAPGSALPTGLSLSSGGVISGTPTTPGSYNFSITVTDSTGGGTPLSDTQAFSLTVTSTAVTLEITTTTLGAMEVGQTLSVQLQAVGGTTPYTWSVNTGSTLPSWLTLSTSGLIEGTATATGTFNFTLKVTDAVAATDTQAYSLIVSQETLPCKRGRVYTVNNLRFEYSTYRRSVAPTAAPPDCATSGDKWFNTTTQEQREANITNGVLTWVLPTGGGSTQIPQGVVILDDLTPPASGDFIIANESGGWTKSGPEDIRGLDASAIKTGIIDPARLPASGGGGGSIPSVTITMIAGAPVTMTNVAAGGSEIQHANSANNRYRVRVDTQNYITAAMYGSISTACGGTTKEIRIEYWTGSAWAASGIPNISCDTPGVVSGAFGTLVTGARGQDTVFRPYYVDGDGTTDGAIVSLYIQFRP